MTISDVIWYIVVPEATTNYLRNPSLEVDTQKYTNHLTGTATGTRARSNAWAKRGGWSWKFEKTGGGASDEWGAYASVDSADVGDFVSGEYVTFSVDINLVGSATATIELNVTAGGTLNNTLAITADGRYEITVGPLAATATAIDAYVYVTSATGVIYADGWQVENRNGATTYIDGDQDGGEWLSTFHLSTSTRSNQSRAGGVKVDLTDYNFTVTTSQGPGMPPIRHLFDRQPLTPGALFRRSKVDQRSFTLTSNSVYATSTATLLANRKELIELIKPDLVSPEQPFWLIYSLDDVERWIKCHYDDGLGYNNARGADENIPIRLIAYDPFWVEDGTTVAALDTTEDHTGADYGAARIDGVWQALGTGFNNTARQVRQSPDGSIIYVGNFTTADGVSAIDVARWLGSTFEAIGTGTNGDVYCQASKANGDLYIGGTFTTASGTSANRIALWDKSANTWSALGTGLNGTPEAMAIHPNGDLYVVGAFTTAGGTTVNGIARWDGSTWFTVGTGTGFNALSRDLIISKDGSKIYVTGLFTTIDAVSANYIAEWDVDNTTWAALGTGLSASGFTVVIGPDNAVYVGGTFATAGGVSTARVAKWNLSAWESLNGGFTGTSIIRLKFADDGLLYASGNFTGTTAGLTITNNLAVWNGSAWAHFDFEPPGTPSVVDIETVRDNIYLAYGNSGTGVSSGITTVSPSGTGTTYPVLTITRDGGTEAIVKYLRNITTSSELYLDYSLLDGEALVIDFRPGRRVITSNFAGVVWRALLPNSDFATFRLQPGDNKIALWVDETGSPTVTANLIYTENYWSLDGAT
jgi:hypothetical protein